MADYTNGVSPHEKRSLVLFLRYFPSFYAKRKLVSFLFYLPFLPPLIKVHLMNVPFIGGGHTAAPHQINQVCQVLAYYSDTDFYDCKIVENNSQK